MCEYCNKTETTVERLATGELYPCGGSRRNLARELAQSRPSTPYPNGMSKITYATLIDSQQKRRWKKV